MENVIIIAIVVIIVALSSFYVYKAKKNGKKCIGCPDGCCSSKGNKSDCCCGCNSNTYKDK